MPHLSRCVSPPNLSREGILSVFSDGIERLLRVLQVFLGEVRLSEGLLKLRMVDDYDERALRLQPHLQHDMSMTMNCQIGYEPKSKSEAFPLFINQSIYL